MAGYEKVNDRSARRSPPARLVDLSSLAAEPPAESIARQNEIVAQFAMAQAPSPRRVRQHQAQRLPGLAEPAAVQGT